MKSLYESLNGKKNLSLKDAEKELKIDMKEFLAFSKNVNSLIKGKIEYDEEEFEDFSEWGDYDYGDGKYLEIIVNPSLKFRFIFKNFSKKIETQIYLKNAWSLLFNTVNGLAPKDIIKEFSKFDFKFIEDSLKTDIKSPKLFLYGDSPVLGIKRNIKFHDGKFTLCNLVIFDKSSKEYQYKEFWELDGVVYNEDNKEVWFSTKKTSRPPAKEPVIIFD